MKTVLMTFVFLASFSAAASENLSGLQVATLLTDAAVAPCVAQVQQIHAELNATEFERVKGEGNKRTTTIVYDINRGDVIEGSLRLEINEISTFDGEGIRRYFPVSCAIKR